MTVTNAAAPVLNLLARKGDARPAARHPLALDPPAAKTRDHTGLDGAAAGANGLAGELETADWRRLIANSRVLDLPVHPRRHVAQPAPPPAQQQTAGNIICRANRPEADVSSSRSSPGGGDAPTDGEGPPLSFKIVLRMTAKQRQLLRISAAALDRPQQALLRTALDRYFQSLRVDEMRRCSCFRERMARPD